MSKKQQKIIYKNNLPKLNNHIFDQAKFAFNTQIPILGPTLALILGMFLGMILGMILGTILGTIPGLILGMFLGLILGMILGTILGTIPGLILGSVLGSNKHSTQFLGYIHQCCRCRQPIYLSRIDFKKLLVSYNGLKSTVENCR